MSSVTKSAAKAKKSKGRGAKPKSTLKRQFQFTENGKTRRETLYVGQRKAEEIARINSHVNALLEAKRYGERLPEPTRQWIRETECKEPAIIEKLKAVGLIETTDNPTVSQFADAFVARKRNSVSSDTVYLYGQAVKDVKMWFGSKRLVEVTKADALDFWEWLITGDARRKKLGRNTAKRHLSRVREMFGDALEREYINRNPFVSDKLPVTMDAADKKYVPAATIQAVINSLPADKLEWKLVFAFGRFIGCRMPSEIRALTWNDVNFEANTILLKSPKTKCKGKPERMVPIFSEVASLLLAQSHAADNLVSAIGRDAAGDAAIYVFPTLRNHSNAATTAAKMVNAAGFASWPKFWNSLRASCETDLMDRYGLRKACAWIGNTPAVAVKHYSLLKATDFTEVDRAGLVAGLVAETNANYVDTPRTQWKPLSSGETRERTETPKTKQNIGETRIELPRMDSN